VHDPEHLSLRPALRLLREDASSIEGRRDPREGPAGLLPGDDSADDSRFGLEDYEPSTPDVVSERSRHPVEATLEGLLAHPVADPLPDDSRFQFGERRDDLDEEPAKGAARVDRLVDGREVDVLSLHLPLRREEVVQVPIQTIELRDDDGRDSRCDSVDDQAVPDRPQQAAEPGSVRRPTGKPVVDELADERVPLCGAIRPDAGPLCLDREALSRLILRADSEIRDSDDGVRRGFRPLHRSRHGMRQASSQCRQKVSNPGSCLLLHSPVLTMTASRKRNEETTRFLVECLRSHPGSRSAEILVRADQQVFSRAAVYRHLRTLIDNDLVSKARGRYWLGRIEDAELAVQSEVERTLAILRSSQISDASKLEAARQLARESGHASLRSREVIELLQFVTGAPKEIRIAILPFAFRVMHAAVRNETTGTKSRLAPWGKSEDLVGARYSRQLWEVMRVLIAPFLRTSGGLGTLAWNTAYEAVDAPGFLEDTEVLELVHLALDIETRRPLPWPSAARAVLRRAAKEARLRDQIRLHLLRRPESMKNEARRGRVLELIRAIDVGPFSPQNPNESAATRA
jgi:hypothetical protein